MPRHPGRGGAAWQRVRADVIRNARACAICGEDLDPNAPPRSPMSTTVDHIIPLAQLRAYDAETQRRMALDPALLRAAHLSCNSRRGARTTPAKPEPRRTSRPW